MSLWIARLAWIALPLTVGSAIADATDGWPRASGLVLAALSFAGWTIGTVALLAPRPRAFSALRVVAPAAVAVAAWTIVASSSGWRAVALVHAIVGAVLALGEPVADAAAGAAAYGTEQRFALRVPPPLLPILGAVVALAIAGFASGPLLLADRRWIAGTIATVIGLPLALASLRSVHTCERRFVVLVPAGLVVADALVLNDPVLLPRERIRAVHRAAPDAAGPSAIDTRLGAVIGGLEVHMDEAAPISLRGGRATASRDVDTVLFTPLRADAVLRGASTHRLPVTS